MTKYHEAQATANKTPAFRGGKITAYQGKELVTFKAKKLTPADLARLKLPRDTLIYRWSSTLYGSTTCGTEADVVKQRAKAADYYVNNAEKKSEYRVNNKEKARVSSAEYYVNNKERLNADHARYVQGLGFASSWALQRHKNSDAPKRGPRPTAAVLQQPLFAALVTASAAGDMPDDEVASQLVSIVGLVRVDEYKHSEATPWARTHEHMNLHTLMTIISDIDDIESSPPCRMRTAA